MSKNVAVYNFYCRIMSQMSKNVAVHSGGGTYHVVKAYAFDEDFHQQVNAEVQSILGNKDILKDGEMQEINRQISAYLPTPTCLIKGPAA